MKGNGRTDADLSMSRGHVGQAPMGWFGLLDCHVGKSYKPARKTAFAFKIYIFITKFVPREVEEARRTKTDLDATLSEQ